MKSPRIGIAVVLACSICACGGGGGGGGGGESDASGGVSPPSTSSSTSIDPLSGILTTTQPLTYSWTMVNGIPVRTPAGTRAYDATLTVGTQSRRYVVIRPDPKPLSAPLMMILHPRDTTPELTANFTHVADFVATQGIWAVMPEAVGGAWKGEQLEGTDDMLFIGALLDALIADGVDQTRITVAGYSSGGVMTQRLACEMADRIAAFGMVAATMPLSQYLSCSPSQPRPKVYVLGTDDPLVPYDGVAGLGSAASLMDWWANEQGCTGVVSTPLPDIADDGTTVQLDEHTGCIANRGLRLYTVQNGEHTWPGGDTDVTGRTSRDMSATGAIWSFARGFRR
jgi:polyhydroxybutyrate depolymerase